MYCNKKQKPFFVCPVCHETGTDITSLSHWVRSKTGSVVCPTLLGQKCSTCGDSGHLSKKCLERKREERDLRRHLYRIEAATTINRSLIIHQPVSRREEELKRIFSNTKKKPEVAHITEKEKQIIRVFNVV